ncbi:MAG: hypothetical protein J5677_04725 [Bacteroidales bacterium]|nr:hypothetical protein [Bacteroidales bacterium]
MEELLNVPDVPTVSDSGKFWKNLLYIVLGTTLSILLTFGTSQIVAQHRKAQERKMTALMVMGSVEKFAQKMDDVANELANRDTLATYQLRIPIDSLDSPEYEYLVTKEIKTLPHINYDKTSENIFINSIGTWRSKRDFVFINKAGTCFAMMKTMEEIYFKYREEFIKPWERIHENPDRYPGKTLGSKYLHDKEYREMLEQIHRKVAYYRYLANKMREMNAINMSIMGVSEKEVLRFIEESEDVTEADNNSKMLKDFVTPPLDPDSLPDIKTWLGR